MGKQEEMGEEEEEKEGKEEKVMDKELKKVFESHYREMQGTGAAH